MFVPFLLFVMIQSSTALNYKLNDSDYERMPPLYHLDSYEECFNEPDAMFCYGEFVLISDEPSELLTMTQEFSKTYRHYNHTLLRYGYCMKKTCNEFYNVSESDVDLRSSFEACSNKTIYNKYKLKTRLTDEIDCSKRDRDLPIDYLDVLVGAICILIVMANLIGSLCDYFLGLKLLYSFSIYRNLKKFIAPAGEGQDPRFKTLRGIHGIRAINTILVVTCHASYRWGMLLVNPELLEGLFEIKFITLFMSGSLIMQSFFLVSSFLLVYNWLLDSEKRPLSWSMLPRQIIRRWLRLTPSYALVIGLTVTWFRRLASGGPTWAKTIYYEARDCRRNWWTHILYINNYVKPSNCMVQTWYLAADTQLYVFGVIIFLLCRTNLTRKVILSVFFVVGIIVPILHTYYQELNGVLVASPDVVLNLFLEDPTFKNVFSRGHTNLVGCIIGIALGYIIYNWQKAGGDPKQFQKYRYIYWSLFPVAASVCFSGCILFVDDQPAPMYVHLLIAGLQKPAFGFVIATIIAGVVIQFEGLYRTILEWRPFVFIGRLSYSAYLLHVSFIRTEVASIMSLQRTTVLGVVLHNCTVVVGVFIAALIFCLLVEMPIANVVSDMFNKPHTTKQNIETVKATNKKEGENGIDISQTKTKDENRIDMTQTKTKDENGIDMTQTKTKDENGIDMTQTKTKDENGIDMTQTKTKDENGIDMTQTKTKDENGIDMTQTKTKDENGIDMTQTKTKDENGKDISQIKTEDGTIVIQMGTRI